MLFVTTVLKVVEDGIITMPVNLFVVELSRIYEVPTAWKDAYADEAETGRVCVIVPLNVSDDPAVYEYLNVTVLPLIANLAATVPFTTENPEFVGV